MKAIGIRPADRLVKKRPAMGKPDISALTAAANG